MIFISNILKPSLYRSFFSNRCLKMRICAPFYRSFSQISVEKDALNKKYITFREIINERKQEARRSIIVQVQSSKSHKELYEYCNRLGNVVEMCHYSTGEEPLHFIIVVFSTEEEVKHVLSSSVYVDEAHVVPVFSTFLWFRASDKKGRLEVNKREVGGVKLSVKDANRIPSQLDILNAIQSADSVSHQMTILHTKTKLNDVGARLRFLVAKQIEESLSGMFPNVLAYPFGSSVNGYGKMGCDLDLVLKLSDKSDKESRLIFHSKAANGSDRAISRRHMEVIGDVLHLFLPGCTHVMRILQARVPIIKFFQQFADIECDLSMSNMSGVHMSNFLYLMSEIDDRTKPLVFTIRHWAEQVGITNSSPGRWITNFSLTLLTLGFLQKPLDSAAVLPSLNELVKAAGSEDKYITEDGVNCTFLRDLNKLTFKTKNNESLETLLRQFFEYYAQFDFKQFAICLNEGMPIRKPDHSVLYIVNPLERDLNVSKNVSLEELEKFRSEAQTAAWILESRRSKSQNWGILSLFAAPKKSDSFIKQTKLIEVSKLFEVDEEEENDVKKRDESSNVNNTIKEKVIEQKRKKNSKS